MIQKGAAPLAGVGAPDFALKTFEGQSLNLSELRGKAIVLNFWASWCNPCREEAPILEATWRKYKDQGLLVIGVDYVDTETEAKKYMAEFKITYPNGPDVQTRISQTYRITGVPETYFITRDGKLLSGTDTNGRAYGNWIGPIPAAALQERVDLLMKK
jgi:cytochrome c biogenesis protein CcmG/thiol:disulfide interchange protein DsbE